MIKHLSDRPCSLDSEAETQLYKIWASFLEHDVRRKWLSWEYGLLLGFQFTVNIQLQVWLNFHLWRAKHVLSVKNCNKEWETEAHGQCSRCELSQISLFTLSPSSFTQCVVTSSKDEMMLEIRRTRRRKHAKVKTVSSVNKPYVNKRVPNVDYYFSPPPPSLSMLSDVHSKKG